MIVFPNAKINIGVNILSKRNDGFHNLQSVFYPIKLTDVLEIAISSDFVFNVSGVKINGNINNLVIRAFNLLSANYNMPKLKIHLHKAIPIEAGLGGGSADAAFMLKLLNKFFQLNISNTYLHKYADKIGSDCSFFIDNKPSFVTGKGEKHSYLPNFLKGKYLVLIKPFNISISTKEAFQNIKINNTNVDISAISEIPIDEWKQFVTNDFEKYAFEKFPELDRIKQFLYNSGAKYASMSGSGSAIYGIYDKNPNITKYKDYFVWNEVLS
jgi:4-diphosphocytidyl-2-C-methyl-D-erythritol kinase